MSSDEHSRHGQLGLPITLLLLSPILQPYSGLLAQDSPTTRALAGAGSAVLASHPASAPEASARSNDSTQRDLAVVGSTPSSNAIFGPKKFTRTTAQPNVFQERFSLDQGLAGSYVMRIQNGDVTGSNRLSSAIVKLNGKSLLTPSDLNQKVDRLEVPVTLNTQNVLDVELRSGPEGYLLISILSPALVSLVPNEAHQGERLAVAIASDATNFVGGQTLASFGSGVRVASALPGSFGPVTVFTKTTAVAQLCVQAATIDQWAQIYPAGEPAVGSSVTAFDPNTRTLISFGGGTTQSPAAETNQVKILRTITGTRIPASWQTLAVSGTQPVPRRDATVVYDPSINRLILFGGISGTLLLDDLWVLTNANGTGGQAEWTQIKPPGRTPPARALHSAVFDTKTNRMTIYGGCSQANCNAVLGDVWVLEGANGAGNRSRWNSITPSGTPPAKRSSHTAVFDEQSNRMLIFGGDSKTSEFRNDVWVLTGANGLGESPRWVKQSPAGPSIPGRWHHGAAYDESSGEMTVFGGRTAPGVGSNDVWVLSGAFSPDNQAWSQRQPGGNPPAPRDRVAVAFDPCARSLILVGGKTGSTGASLDASETWLLTPNMDAAAPGARTATVRTGTEVVSLVDGFRVLGAPRIASSNPAAGSVGQSGLLVTLTGEFTSFIQGTTRASFGPGISVGGAPAGSFGPVAVLSSTQATATLSIQAGAKVGSRPIVVETGAEHAIRLNGFDVLLTNLAPVVNAGPDQTITLPATATLSGSATDDGLPAGSVLSVAWSKVSGPGAVTFGNPALAATTAAFSLPGAYVLRLTASDSLLSSSDDVAVVVQAPPTPAILTINPNAGRQGSSNLEVVITAQYSNFTQGTSAVSFGAGITVVSVSVASKTGLTARVSIDPAATVGIRTVSVTTGAETVSLANAFSVQPGTPVLLTVAPNSGQQGQANLDVVISGQYTQFVQGSTAANFGAGITVTGVTVSSPTSLTAKITLAADATVGSRTATVTTGTEVVSLIDVFTVTAGTPVITLVNPNGGQQGQTNLNVALTGRYTNWVQGTSKANFGAGITVNSLSVSSATSATANISILASSAIRQYVGPAATTVSLFQAETGALATTPIPALSGNYQSFQSLTLGPLTFTRGPNSTGMQFGGNSGVGFDWSSLLAGNEIAVNGVEDIDIDIASPVYSFGFYFHEPSLPGSGTDKCDVAQCIDSTFRITLKSGSTVVGSFEFNATDDAAFFVGMLTDVPFSRVEIRDLGGSVDDEFFGQFFLGSERKDSALGSRSVTVTSGPEVASCSDCFTVTAVPILPVITSVNPSTGQQGQTNLTVAITGSNTHFVQGTTKANFGEGITVNSVTIASAASLSVSVSISPFAAVGTRTITATTGSEVVALPNGFTVLAGAPCPNGVKASRVYTQSYFAGRVSVIDPVSNAVIATLPLEARPGTMALKPDYRQLWVTLHGGTTTDTAGNKVAVIDTYTNKIIAQVETGKAPTQVRFNASGSRAFVTNALSDTLSVIDTATLKVIDTIPTETIGAGDFVLSPDEKRLFITSYLGSSPLSVLDLESRTVTKMQRAALYKALHPSGSEVWATNRDEIWLFSPTTLETLATISTPGAGALGVTFSVDGSTAYIAYADLDAVAVFDVGLRKFLTLIDGVADSPNQLSLTADGMRAYVTGFGEPAVSVLDTSTRTIIAKIPVISAGIHVTSGMACVDAGPSINREPEVSAGVDLTINQSTATLTGFATDDGLPVNAPFSLTWSKVSGPGTVTFANPNQAATTATFGTPGTYVLRLTASDSVLSGTDDLAVTVNAVTPTPAITSVIPNSGQQGQTNLNVVVTGLNTHFVQGTTIASFGIGISVNSVTVASATSLTANLTIAAGATVGVRSVAVTTGTEIVSLANGFTVQQSIQVPTCASGVPALRAYVVNPFTDRVTVIDPLTNTKLSTPPIGHLSHSAVLSPDGKYVLVTVYEAGTVDVIDAYTNKRIKTIATGSGASGVTINRAGTRAFVTNRLSGTVSVIDMTSLAVVKTIATEGIQPHWVGVSVDDTKAYIANLASDFLTVIDLATDLTSKLPLHKSIYGAFRPQSEELWVSDNGLATAGSGFYSVISTADGQLLATVPTTPGAVNEGIVFSPDGLIAYANLSGIDQVAVIDSVTRKVLTVIPVGDGPNQIALTPDGKYAYVTALNSGGVSVIDTALRAVTKTIASDQGLGVAVGYACVPNVAPANAAPSVNAGPDQDILITGTAALAGFYGDDGLPIDAKPVIQWSQVSGSGTVTFTAPSSATTNASFSLAGVYVLRLTVSDSVLTSSDDVQVTVAGAVPVPALTSVSPNTGQQGQVNLNVAITGSNTAFAQGTTTLNLGPGVTVNSVAVSSPTALSAAVSIAADAAIGLRTVTVTTGSEVVSLPGGFSVTAAPVVPSITSVSPSSGQQGQVNLEVTISGSSTNFSQGATVVSFGTGITVVSTTVSSPTAVNATVSITLAAATGPRTVSVTTGAEAVSFTNGFTVLAVTPTITVDPTSAYWSQALDLVITGVGTSFLQGTTKAKINPDVSIAKANPGEFGPVSVANSASASARACMPNPKRWKWTALAPTGELPPAQSNNYSTGMDPINNRLIYAGWRTEDPSVAVWVVTDPDGVQSSPKWQRLNATGVAPPRRHAPAVAYDVLTNRLIVYGGGGQGSGYFNDVWVLTNANGLGGIPEWTQLVPTGTPPIPRAIATVVFDPATNRLTMFGGCRDTCDVDGNTPWVLTNANGSGGQPSWIQLQPEGAPPSPRGSHTSVYDPSTNRMILFGGDPTGYTPPLNDTWVLTNANGLGGVPHWILLKPHGVEPPGTWNHAAVYLPAQNRMIVATGVDLSKSHPTNNGNFAWVLDNANGLGGQPTWAELEPGCDLPPVRENAAAVYNPKTNRTILFGSNVLSDMWVLSSDDYPGTVNADLSTIVDAKANIFSSGGANPAGDGIPAPCVSLPAGASRTVRVSSVSGTVSFGGSMHGPDGADPSLAGTTGTNLKPQGGLSGLDADPGPVMFLSGVFLGPVAPTAPPPPTTNFIGGSVPAQLSPQIGQLFYIGDGLSGTGSGALLEFHAPASATRLCLGFGEGPNFKGDAGLYGDNSGALDVGLSINTLNGGHRDVRVETAGEVAFISDGFTVRTTNLPPVVDPGPDRSLSSPGSITLTGVVTDDGLPGAGGLSVAWGMVRGPAIVSFGSPYATTTTAMFPVNGTYVLRLTATDSVLTANNDVFVTVGPGASLSSLTPSSAQIGQSNIGIVITGQSTNFAQGVTQAGFGAGITVNSLAVTSPTSLTANISVKADAAPGPRTVTIVSGSEIVSLTDGITVIGSTPSPGLLSVNPNSGQQGQSSLNIVVAGQSTSFTQGLSSVNFGAGVTVNSVSVASATSLTANITIAAGAAVGTRTVTVTTGSEVVSLPSGFQVTAGTPRILSLNPASVMQGQTANIALGAEFTNFVQGVTQASFGAGVTVNTITVTSGTSLSANITVGPAAAVGPRTITITTGTEVVTLAGVFQVMAGVPQFTLISPVSAPQGASLQLNVTSSFTNFQQGVTQVSLGSGITVGAVTVSSTTSLTAALTVDPAAAPGPRTLTVTTGTEVVTKPDAFSVTTGSAYIESADPGGGYQGETLDVQLTGKFTSFSQGSTVVSLGAGITINSVKVASPTSLTANVTIAPSAAIGSRNITVTTGAEVATFPGGFQVVAGIPELLTVSPNTAKLGETLTVTLTGQSTHFAQGTTQANFDTGITVNSITVSSPTSFTANITIAANAPVGPRAVIVTTGTEVVGLNDAFTVVGTPRLISTTPNTGQQGQQNLNVVVAGQFTNFAAGVSQASFGAGVTVNSVTVTTATSLTANLSIDPTATIGLRTVTVSTGAEVVTLVNGFGVTSAANQAPVITIAPTWSVTLPNRLLITYTVTDDGKPAGGALTVTWDKISGPGEHGFKDQTIGQNPDSISVGFSEAGTYILRISATDTEFVAARDITVTVTGTPQDPPTVSIATPIEGQEITTFIDVVGTANSPDLKSWTLEMRPVEEAFFRSLATGTAPVLNAKLGVFDPTLLLNGNVEIRVKATDNTGQTSTSAPVTVVLAGNQKIGHFTVSFKDYESAEVGVPIQLIRTYDSRSLVQGDFGVGWRLDIRHVRVRDNGTMGTNWQGTSTGGILPTYCVVGTKPHIVTVTDSAGEVYKFEASVSPNCQQLVPIQQATLVFSQVSGPKATLSLLGSNQITVVGSWPGSLDLWDLNETSIVDIEKYRLTLPDGRSMEVSRTSGLEKLTDLNANSITITPAGIVHSNGRSIAFTRDMNGRITQVTDPAGKTLRYAYDQSGNLATFTDPASQASTYTYDTAHRLLTIKDPRGIEPIRNEYDSDGRLIGHLDAFGNLIAYEHDFANRREVVTDRLGNATVNEYDSNGNVIKVTDALGGVTQRTYDARDNMTKEIDPLGGVREYTYDGNDNRTSEKDPLGNVTLYEYNALNRVTKITDALGQVTENSYDANGNLTSTKDALGNTTAYTYNASGLMTSMTDPLNRVTVYSYDGAGRGLLLAETNPLNQTTTYAYDASGNRTSETRQRTTTGGPETLVTLYEYDALNRLVKTTYPDGSTTQTAFNAIGKQSETTDQLGRKTTYLYDDMGRLTQTTYADLTTEKSEYDKEGRRTKSIDKANRATTFEYDKLGRLTRTIFPDSTSTSTVYDAAGQVVRSIDARNNATEYQYDAAGRRTKLTDALGRATGFSYDKAGNQESMTDANGSTTQFQYDKLNRRIRVVHPDSTLDQTAYDALGRTTSKTDQNGRTTQYEYDALGRLITVIDAKNQLTRYTYDEAGNRLTQTDANNTTTRFEYDKMRRRTKRILPLGMFETMAYDAAGNLKTKVDFNGRITSYDYDEMNRLRKKTPDPTFAAQPVTFSYTATGLRSEMVDPSGTTTYVYDQRNRLTSKNTPQGTLAYSYDQQGNLASIRSSNAGGTSVDYAYDALNRLAQVTDNRLTPGATTYQYDLVGNLKSYTYPNSVTHAYTYNKLNRLTDLTVNAGATPIASYSYTLGPSGNRTKVVELGGRTVDYTYDELYQLTSETITGGTVNGTIGYVYDPVGNRKTRTSTVAPVPPQSFTYDANDRLDSDTYDANGNTMSSGGVNYTYEYENRLVTKNGAEVVIIYDGDGNRVAKTVGGVTTRYLVDTQNLTGYAQVLEEVAGGALSRTYTYGLDLISQTQASGTSFYGYDGHGNARLLTDAAGSVTDRYDYDAFGNLISQAGTTLNLNRFLGEYFEPDISYYYLRARYYDTQSGRFQTTDPAAGVAKDPQSLHRYLYSAGDPLNKVDLNGQQYTTIQGLMATVTIHTILQSIVLENAVPALIVATGVKGFFKPGFQMRNFALTAMASGILEPQEWASAQNIYQAGSTLITIGSGVIGDSIYTWNKVLLAVSFVQLANSIASRPRLQITREYPYVVVERWIETCRYIDEQSKRFVLQIVQREQIIDSGVIRRELVNLQNIADAIAAAENSLIKIVNFLMGRTYLDPVLVGTEP